MQVTKLARRVLVGQPDTARPGLGDGRAEHLEDAVAYRASVRMQPHEHHKGPAVPMQPAAMCQIEGLAPNPTGQRVEEGRGQRLTPSCGVGELPIRRLPHRRGTVRTANAAVMIKGRRTTRITSDTPAA